ncbi:hypothetical protein FRC11_007868, partial [Ceratobasidium sp. 423]
FIEDLFNCNMQKVRIKELKKKEPIIEQLGGVKWGMKQQQLLLCWYLCKDLVALSLLVKNFNLIQQETANLMVIMQNQQESMIVDRLLNTKKVDPDDKDDKLTVAKMEKIVGNWECRMIQKFVEDMDKYKENKQKINK